MSDRFSERQTGAVRRVFADVTACSPETFSVAGVHVTGRPEPPVWPFTAMIVGFGTGLVACVEERYVEWAKEHSATTPGRANYLAIPLAAEGAVRGDLLHPQPPMIGWALSKRMPTTTLPTGYKLARVDKSWMDEWQPKDRFTNALGLSVQIHRAFRNRFAYVVSDSDGGPAAVSGVFDTAGLSEIGVDVAEAHRGIGLSKAVVAAACADLIEADQTPFYVCEVRNILSQHTALGSGFMPVCSLSLVMPAGLGLE